MNITLKKRLLSLAWRAGMMILAGGIAYLAKNLNVLDLSPETTVFIGLILGEISKYLNTPVQK